MHSRPRLGRRLEPIASEPDVPAEYKAVVWQALRWAWSEARAQSPRLLAAGREEEVTECVQRLLNEQDANGERRAPGLACFETVNRGAKVASADSRIEKAPDLVFRPVPAHGVRNRGDWGVFVECKLIAQEAHHSPEQYCVAGVARFVRGEYAPRMPSGAMLAYVRDARLPHSSLEPLLDDTYCTLSFESDAANATCHSAHARNTLPQPCVDIAITHVWLDASARRGALGDRTRSRSRGSGKSRG